MSRFDRFAEAVAVQIARAWFFVACVLLVALWAPSILVLRDVDTWQLIINTATTIVTFLLVALLHNTSERFERRMDERLEALFEHLGVDDPCADRSKTAL